jgi:hypothetical protein
MKGIAMYSYFSIAVVILLIYSSTIMVDLNHFEKKEDVLNMKSTDQISIDNVDVDDLPMEKDISITYDNNRTKKAPYCPINEKQFIESDSSVEIMEKNSYIEESIIKSRACDVENNDSYGFLNGSVIERPTDTLIGTLQMGNFDDFNSGSHDMVDHYKLYAGDVDPSPFAHNGTIIVTITLESYTSDSFLYEKRYDQSNNILSNFSDHLYQRNRNN